MAGLGRSLHAGIYQFPQHAALGAVLKSLRNGDAMRFRVTLPNGGTLFDLAHSAHQQLGIAVDSVLVDARDSALRRRFDVSGPSLEGWLLPQSFDFGGFDDARQVLSRFATARQQQWDPDWDARADSAGLHRAGLLSLASIVEAEARDPAERPLIAAVYRNRLARDMPLQADPTIEYAMLLNTGSRKGRLFNTDYGLVSPWNTYLHTGLPPGPIGNPSREAIEAVLAPARVDYLYFVADHEGKTLFARTYAEHLRNVRKIQRH